ncbi:MAG: hypothetical protein J6Z31_08540 [Fibrobacter sp.]|nr:hypothetical protein [Fibrobacter sp.]
MKTDYQKSYLISQKIGEKNPGAACVLRNVARLSEFDDVGDTLALEKAAKELAECSAEGAWDVLRAFELGYAQTSLGSSFKGALGTRSAAKKFEDVADKDAQAFYAIYAYYVDDGLSFLPFVSDDREAYLKILEERSQNSELFWALFATPLAWMYYDKQEYGKALKVVERALSKAPQNPVFLQMKADMLYKQQKYGEAATIYEQSAKAYLTRTGKSVRYFCAVGNLARIYLDAGELEKSKSYAKKLVDPEYEKIEKWMPGSLVKDLKKKDLYP